MAKNDPQPRKMTKAELAEFAQETAGWLAGKDGVSEEKGTELTDKVLDAYNEDNPS